MLNLKRTITLVASTMMLQFCTATEPVIAEFNYIDGTNGAVFFKNQSLGQTSLEWDFGTGDRTTENSPNYTFKENKEYAVTLTARGKGGQNSKTKTVKISNIPTTGGVVFWRTFAESNVAIYVEGRYYGLITKYVTNNSAPSCNLEGLVTVTLPAGTYNFAANTDERTPRRWSGQIRITNGACGSMWLQN